jgi:hypothetical protein
LPERETFAKGAERLPLVFLPGGGGKTAAILMLNNDLSNPLRQSEF